jgi:hypothetical protein
MNDVLRLVGGSLNIYIEVHDDIFRFKWRRILPLPWLFEPIDFSGHVLTLEMVQQTLDDVLNGPQSPATMDDGREAVLRDYVVALRTTVTQLGSICRKLARKADLDGQYEPSEYRGDVALYEKSVSKYQALGDALNKRVYG